MISNFFDELEKRTLVERDEDNLNKLIELINKAKQIPIHKGRLEKKINTLDDLEKIPVFRKSDLINFQQKKTAIWRFKFN